MKISNSFKSSNSSDRAAQVAAIHRRHILRLQAAKSRR